MVMFVNGLVLALLSCSTQQQPSVLLAPEQAPPTFRASSRLGTWQPDTLLPVPPRSSPPPPAAPTNDSTLASDLLPDLAGAAFDRSYGEALDDAIAALPDDREALGIHGMSMEALFGSSGGLCEDPHVTLQVEDETGTYDVSLQLPAMLWMDTDPQPDLYPLSDACVAALAATGGDLSALGEDCTDNDAAAHYPEDSSCYTCLRQDGDHSRCVDEGACPEQAARHLVGTGVDYTIFRMTTVMCAPDHVSEGLALIDDCDESGCTPDLYDHGAVDLFCWDMWSEDDDAPTLGCSSGDILGVGDVLPARLDGVTPAEGGEAAWAGRVALLSSLEIEGTTFSRAQLTAAGAQAISAPVGTSADAWGFNPTDLRPDGSDPTVLDDLRARDYIAAYALKTATTIDGVVVWPFDNNRCDEDDWEALDDGRSWCEAPGAWSSLASGWSDDAFIGWWDSAGTEWYAMPLVTLVSTGTPDPSIPGGLAPHVLSSSTLADPQWEDCSWPDTFEPDLVRMFDSTPGAGTSGYATFDGQTWRFGRSDGPDVRIALATNERRSFCPTGL